MLEKYDLEISCVVFNSDPDWLRRTIRSLAIAVCHAVNMGQIKSAKLCLIDNHPDQIQVALLKELASSFKADFRVINIIFGHGNLGYGGGHNLAILESQAPLHLVLNPDVELFPDSLIESVMYLAQYPECVLVAPDGFDPSGERQYLAKRQPSLLVLLARAVNIRSINQFLTKSLTMYEYRDKIPSSEPVKIELASGCFMLARGSVLRQIGGFNKNFFMYFEDFELCLRLGRIGSICHLPQVKIVHQGGGVGRKGFAHLKYFYISFIKYKLIYWKRKLTL